MIGTPGPSATRRAALAGSVAGLLGVAGCDLGHDSAPAADAPTSAAPDDDPDAALVAEAVAGTRHALGLLAALPRRHHRAVAGLDDLHRAHLEALEAPARPAGHPARPTVAEVRGSEVALQRRLARLATTAQSGQLARLLASMSAGIAAHVAATSGVRP